MDRERDTERERQREGHRERDRERDRKGQRQRGTDRMLSGGLAVVLGSLLGGHDERSHTGEGLRHLQELMLRRVRGREKERMGKENGGKAAEGTGGGGSIEVEKGEISVHCVKTEKTETQGIFSLN